MFGGVKVSHNKPIVKKRFVAFLIAGLIPATVSSQSDMALAHVHVNVTPNVLVQPAANQPAVIPAVSGEGVIPINAFFSVSANSDRVQFGCVATALYRASVVHSEERIQIKPELGCLIDTPYANPLAGASRRAAYDQSSSLELNGFPALATNFIAFESFQGYQFSMDVVLTIHYVVNKPNLPQGRYGGLIKLVAMVL